MEVKNNGDIIIQVEDESNYFSILPIELIVQLFSYLDEEALAQVSQVCKSFFFTIINHADLILYERLSKECRGLPMSKQLLIESLTYWSTNESALDAPDLPKLLKDKQHSPLKINSFFRERNRLVTRGELAVQQSSQLRHASCGRLTKLFSLAMLPAFLGYLSGSSFFLFIGITLCCGMVAYGICQELKKDVLFGDQIETNLMAIPPLYKAALQPKATAYEEGTLSIIKKYS